MLAILEYKAGNQTSVRRALTHLGIPCVITADPRVIADADGIIFPGVGAAGQAMNELLRAGLDTVLKKAIAAHKPILGICLGCQIMLEYCEENDTKTLGIIAGECRKFDAELCEEDGSAIRVPHMGWNSVMQKTPCPLFNGIKDGEEFYYVHSYYPAPAPEFIIATTHYGQEFCGVFGRNDLWAVQFHPEKSGKAGLKLLQNFNDYCRTQKEHFSPQTLMDTGIKAEEGAMQHVK